MTFSDQPDSLSVSTHSHFCSLSQTDLLEGLQTLTSSRSWSYQLEEGKRGKWEKREQNEKIRRSKRTSQKKGGKQVLLHERDVTKENQSGRLKRGEEFREDETEEIEGG